MLQLRVTAPDGATTTHPFNGMQCTIGRAPGNDIRLEGTAVSSLHCVFELTGTGCVLRERGSTNGTWVNGQRVEQPMAVTERDRIYVGSFLVEVVRASAEVRPTAPRPAQLEGPILRTSTASERGWREMLGRLGRYSAEWDRKGRPAELALRDDELARARKWLQQATGERKHEVTRLLREFVEASEKVSSGRTVKRVLAIGAGVVALGGLVAAAIIFWPESSSDPEPEGDTDVAATETGEAEESSGGGFEQLPVGGPEGDMDEVGKVDQAIKHIAIPFETLNDIATRYGVTVDEIAAWNYLNPDDANLKEGSEVLIEEPKRRPLAQTKVDYEVEDGEASWTRLADRFGVTATRLEAYNAGVELKAGATIAVWIDPKPYEPRDPDAKVPDYDYGTEAQSIGRTNNGRVQNGMQLPESPLYERRSPHLMYGSSYTIEHLAEGIAAFRQEVAYDGKLNLSDISRKTGGHLEPHKSHQAGRDIDIWLPTLKGVYKVKYFKGGGSRERRPLRAEVDWYALFGLVRALIRTKAVEEIYLDWIYQEYVYRAAVNMGATPEELDEWIQWPRPRSSSKGIFRHSKDHLSHIHVRFKCAPWEKACDGRRGKVED